MSLHTLQDALQAMLPRVHLHREIASATIRLSVTFPQHKVYGFETVPEAPSVLASDMEEVLRRVFEQGCEQVCLRRKRPGGLAWPLRVAAVKIVDHPLVIQCLGSDRLPPPPDVPGSLWTSIRELRKALEDIAAAEKRSITP